ncbi:MAG: decaprenyl-phosphate phosphoribosyltransferase [Planctomycetota bacterium]
MKNYFRIMRFSHWTKNIFVFVALVFGGKLIAPIDESLIAFASAFGAFLCFSLAASAVYIFNDIIDRKTDTLHPEKSKRPIAAGTVTPAYAAVISALCAVVAITGSLLLAHKLAAVILSYILLMVLYSLLLKRMMILDCIVISIGFCLRAIAGTVAVGVFISPWLIICTFALCLFLGFGKRRSEVIQLQENSEAFRKTLAGYTPELLSHMLDVTSGIAIICFLLYAMDDRTMRIFGTNNLIYTTPLVLYCVFRFSALIQKGKYSGPVNLILTDLPFQIGFLLWGLSCTAIIYADKLADTFGNIWAF